MGVFNYSEIVNKIKKFIEEVKNDCSDTVEDWYSCVGVYEMNKVEDAPNQDEVIRDSSSYFSLQVKTIADLPQRTFDRMTVLVEESKEIFQHDGNKFVKLFSFNHCDVNSNTIIDILGLDTIDPKIDPSNITSVINALEKYKIMFDETKRSLEYLRGINIKKFKEDTEEVLF